MTVPAADLTTTHLDASTDDPSQARIELKNAIDKINAIINDLGAGNIVWTNANDGAGSGLDADLLDGQHASYYRDASNMNAGTLPLARLPQITAAYLAADSVGSSEIAANAVGSSEIAAGAVGSSEIAANAVGNSELASDAVKPTNLNTSSSEKSTATQGNFTLDGGVYGFYPQVKNSSGSSYVRAEIAQALYNTSYSTNIYLFDESGGTAYGKQEYIVASPPFDLGDGEIPIFTFVLLRDNKIDSVSTGRVPPWMYNGPTNTIADRYDKQGNGYKNRIKAIDRETGEFQMEEVKITQSVKNFDMGLIPHPFLSAKPGDKIVLLDPPATEKLLLLHESGESINDLLHNDYLRIDNEELNRCTPNGVCAHRWKWKKT